MNSGRLWGARLVSLEGRRPLQEAEGTLDLDGNCLLLWVLAGFAYQLFYELRSRLRGAWSVAQPKRLQAWLFRMPSRWTTHGDQRRLDAPPAELIQGLFGHALAALRGPPRYAH